MTRLQEQAIARASAHENLLGELVAALKDAKTVIEIAVAAEDGKQFANLETRRGTFVRVVDVLVNAEAVLAKAEAA